MAINLDTARAARAETLKEAPVIVLDGKEYRLPPELPFVVLEAFRGIGDEASAPGALADVAEGLLGEHYAELRTKLTIDDLNELIGGVMEQYGVSNPPA